MRHNLGTVIGIAGLALLAACQSSGFRSNSGSSAVLESSLTPNEGAVMNGVWLPTDAAAKGVYEAEFKDGVFISRSPTTNKPLAKGNYKVISDKQVDLEFVGAATNTAVQAKCERLTENTLYCVPTVNSPFNLKRS